MICILRFGDCTPRVVIVAVLWYPSNLCILRFGDQVLRFRQARPARVLRHGDGGDRP